MLTVTEKDKMGKLVSAGAILPEATTMIHVATSQCTLLSFQGLEDLSAKHWVCLLNILIWHRTVHRSLPQGLGAVPDDWLSHWLDPFLWSQQKGLRTGMLLVWRKDL